MVSSKTFAELLILDSFARKNKLFEKFDDCFMNISANPLTAGL